jgi:hypothetical protein
MVSQQGVERALGKLVIDVDFRDAFFSNPAAASEAAGIALTDGERSALARIRPGALAAFQRYLDGKQLDMAGATSGLEMASRAEKTNTAPVGNR